MSSGVGLNRCTGTGTQCKLDAFAQGLGMTGVRGGHLYSARGLQMEGTAQGALLCLAIFLNERSSDCNLLLISY